VILFIKQKPMSMNALLANELSIGLLPQKKVKQSGATGRLPVLAAQ
jgi:hypothetical protein